MFFQTIILSFLALFISVTHAEIPSPHTLYEDAEIDSSMWDVYDNAPAGATISRIYDNDKSSYVIEFLGDATANGYRIGHHNAAHTNAWTDTSNKVITWESKFTEPMVVYIPVETISGFRYLY